MALPRVGRYVEILREKLANSIFLPFLEILPEAMIEQALKDEGISYRKRLYTPFITLLIWLCQVLDKDKSCKNAVSRVISYTATCGETPPSSDTGAYANVSKRDSFCVCFVSLVSICISKVKRLRSYGAVVVSSLLMAPPSPWLIPKLIRKHIHSPKARQRGVVFPWLTL